MGPNFCVLVCLPYFLVFWINLGLREQAQTIKSLKSTLKSSKLRAKLARQASKSWSKYPKILSDLFSCHLEFVKDNSMGFVKFINCRKLNVLKDRVKEKLKVFNGSETNINVVGSGDRENVRDIWSHFCRASA